MVEVQLQIDWFIEVLFVTWPKNNDNIIQQAWMFTVKLFKIWIVLTTTVKGSEIFQN